MSSYQDFSSAYSFTILRQISVLEKSFSPKEAEKSLKDIRQELNHFLCSLSDLHLQRDKSWLSRGQTITLNYARYAMKNLYIDLELKDILETLKNTMLCLSYMRQATLRQKALRAIKGLIKIDAQNIVDPQIQQIIFLRLQDVSSGTRESALEIIQIFLQRNMQFPQNSSSREKFMDCFISSYQNEIIIRTQDLNQSVKKRSISIISFLIQKAQIQGQDETNSFFNLQKALIRQWDESSTEVKEIIVKSIQKKLQIILNENSEDRILQVFDFLCNIIFEFFTEAQTKKLDNQKNEMKKFEDLIRVVFKKVLTESEFRIIKKKNTIMKLIGDELGQIALNNLVTSKVELPQQSISLVFIKILAFLEPQIFRKKIKILGNFLELSSGNDDRMTKNILQVLQIIIKFLNQSDGEESIEFLTPKCLQIISTQVYQIIKNKKLKLLSPALELALELCQFKQDYQDISKLYLQMFIYLQSYDQALIQNPKEYKMEQSKVLTISRSILIASHIAHFSKLKSLEQFLKINTVSKINEILIRLVMNKKLNQAILDISIEGLSLIWIQHQDLIIQNKDTLQIFTQIHLLFQKKQLRTKTMQRIVDTLLNFLNIYEERVQQNRGEDMSKFILSLQPHLLQFANYYDPKNFKFKLKEKHVLLREVICLLIYKLNSLNLMHILESCKFFLVMLHDCYSSIQAIGINGISQIAKKKFEIVASCLQPQTFLENVIVMQRGFFKKDVTQITFLKINGSLKSGNILVDSDACQFDELLHVIEENQEQTIHKLFQGLIKYMEDIALAQEKKNYESLGEDFHKIRLAGECSLSLIKTIPKVCLILQNDAQDYLLRTEVGLYEKLKSQKDMNHQALLQCFMVFIMRAFIKLSDGISSIQKSQYKKSQASYSNNQSQDEEEKVSYAAPDSNLLLESQDQKERLKRKCQKLYIRSIEDLKEWTLFDFPKLKHKKYLEEVIIEFRDHLKSLMKEKEMIYKQRIEKKLFGKIRELEKNPKRQYRKRRQDEQLKKQESSEGEDNEEYFNLKANRRKVVEIDKAEQKAKSMQIKKSEKFQQRNKYKRRREEDAEILEENQQDRASVPGKRKTMNRNVQPKSMQVQKQSNFEESQSDFLSIDDDGEDFFDDSEY